MVPVVCVCVCVTIAGVLDDRTTGQCRKAVQCVSFPKKVKSPWSRCVFVALAKEFFIFWEELERSSSSFQEPVMSPFIRAAFNFKFLNIVSLLR